LIAFGHLEDAAMSLFQIHLNVELFFDFSRQTGASFKVASFDAVGDLNLLRFFWVAFFAHNESPFVLVFLNFLRFRT